MYNLILTTILIGIIIIILYQTRKTESKVKENFQDDDTLQVLPKFTYKKEDNGIKFELDLELIYLDPKYDLEIDKFIRTKKTTLKNSNWKGNYMHQICPKKCQCIDLESKDKVCGMYDDNLIYECPGPCPACHKCHQNVNNIQLTYLDFCNQAVSQDEKQRCQEYKDRIVFSKKCFYSKYEDLKLVKRKEL